MRDMYNSEHQNKIFLSVILLLYIKYSQSRGFVCGS